MRKWISSLGIGLVFGGMAFSAFSTKASPRAAETNVVISVNRPAANPGFAAEACKVLQDAVFNWNMGTLPTAPCHIVSRRSSNGSTPWAGNASLRISLFELPDGSHKLHLENIDQADPSDIPNLSWTILPNVDWRSQTQKLLDRYLDFDSQKKRIQEFLLVNGVPESKTVGSNDTGYYDKATGRALSFDEAYAKFRDEKPKHKHYLQAALELTAIWGVSTTNYYAALGDNRRDWDFDAASSFRGRVLTGDAVRFDDNHFRTNRGHYYAGTVYYTVARSNGLDRLESLLYTFAASSSWEYLAEFHEVVSINDQINTTLGGFIIGETLHNLGKLFQSGSNGYANTMLRAIFGSPAKFNNWLAKNTGQEADLSDTGFKPDVWGKAELYTTVDANRNPYSPKNVRPVALGFDAQVVDIPMFEEPGHVRKILTDDVFSQLMVENGLNTTTLENFKFFAKTTLGAYYEKNLGKDKEGNLKGYNLFIGPSTALTINQEGGNGQNDFYGVVHVLGGTLDMTAYTHGVQIRCILDVYGDFAMMRAYGFDTYAQTHDVSHVSSVVRNEGYYYGAGATEDAQISVSAGRWEAGASISHTGSEMITARDRFANGSNGDNGACGSFCNQVDNVKINAHDDRTDAKAWVAYQLTDSLKVKFTAERINRSGNINGGGPVTGTEIRKMGTLIYSFR